MLNALMKTILLSVPVLLVVINILSCDKATDYTHHIPYSVVWYYDAETNQKFYNLVDWNEKYEDRLVNILRMHQVKGNVVIKIVNISVPSNKKIKIN